MKKSAHCPAAAAGKTDFPVVCKKIIIQQNKPDLFFHFHGCVEILFLTEGNMNITLTGTVYELRAGECIIINENEAHSLYSVTPESEYISICFSPDITGFFSYTLTDSRYSLPFLYNGGNRLRVYNKTICDNSGLSALVEDALIEYEKKSTGYELSVTAAILKIIRIAVAYLEASGYETRFSPPISNIRNEISLILGYINENFRQLDEKAVAENFGVSYSYFSRSFKDVMSTSFNEYVNLLKINESKRLLLRTEKSIAEISSELNFSSSSHFINVFRKYNGCSPKQYKKSCSQ